VNAGIHKTVLLEALFNYLGDSHIRMKMRTRGMTEAGMRAMAWGEFGETTWEVLKRLEAHAARVQAAIDAVQMG